MVEGMVCRCLGAGDPTEEQDYMSMINSLLIENKQLEARPIVDCTPTQTSDILSYPVSSVLLLLVVVSGQHTERIFHEVRCWQCSLRLVATRLSV